MTTSSTPPTDDSSEAVSSPPVGLTGQGERITLTPPGSASSKVGGSGLPPLIAREPRSEAPAAPAKPAWSLGPTDRLVLLGGLVLVVVLLGFFLWRWSQQEETKTTVERPAGTSAPYLLDINKATWVEWSQLDGLGEKTARKIVEDRDANGPFKDIDDVGRVKGIGPKTLEKLRPHLTVSPR